jgi:Rad3-related DNA helicase/DNA polymerase III epsilon subunit-like protein
MTDTASQSAAAFHEALPLTAQGRFVSTCPVVDLGLDPDMLDAVLAVGPLCFLDFEATGLSPDSDGLIEVGAVLVEAGSRQARIFQSYIHTELQLSPFIQRLTGIAPEDVESAPSLAEVGRELDTFIADVPIVAHNADFERSWLTGSVNQRFGRHPFLDTIDLLALVYPDSRNMKLDTFCRAKLDRRERHRALDDALDTLRIVVGIWQESRAGAPNGHNAREAARAYLPSSPWLARLDSLPASDRLHTPSGDSSAAESVSTTPVPLQLAAIGERLRNEDGARLILPQYELREPQLELLSNVYECFAGKGGRSVHVCEAGTGIGKTLAYLAVAIAFAKQTGEQVVISTSTKLLQSQLMEKDIPAAARLMGYPDLRFTAMKGRANYLCRARMDRFLDAPLELGFGQSSFATALLAAFSRSAGHGEVDRIPGVLYQLHPDLERFRREVTSADASECSRQTCETTHGDCVFRRARARLDGADLIVVNHDLLLRWPPDYPPLRHLIVDEVHELAERADGAYARSAAAIEIVHRLETVLGRRGDAEVSTDAALIDPAERALALVQRIGDEAWRLAGASNSGYRDELAVPLDGPDDSWNELIDDCVELSRALDGVSRRLAAMADDDESVAAGAAESLVDAATVLRESFPVPPDDLVVRLRGLSRQRGQSWRLVATPVSPAADFQFEILDRAETLFGTSATVMVGDDTRGALGTLELQERAGSRFELDPPIESTFDFAHNLEVLFIDEKTDRDRLIDRSVDVLATVARKLGGRTMGLFTSRDRLSTVSDLLYTALASQGISIIAPSTGNADPHDLVRTFSETDNSVLLGARAFWQGVDVPGDACQAVVIEKLPFDVPGDPLIQRRGELVEREGGNSFMDYMLPRMLLRLKQMAGRLIRTPTDRGVVIVVEPRCDRRYFSRILDAFPHQAVKKKIKLVDLDDALDQFFDSRT